LEVVAVVVVMKAANLEPQVEVEVGDSAAAAVVVVPLGMQALQVITQIAGLIGWVLAAVVEMQDRVLALPEEVMGVVILIGMALLNTMEAAAGVEFIMTRQ
jgi:hypothetical protein